jgi:hydrogenase expression/formation protein HypC
MCLAIPAKVKTLSDDQHFATVEVSGVRRKVNIDLLREENIKPDDWVLLHVGFAMSKISAKEAEEQMELLAMLGEVDEAMEELHGYGNVPEVEADALKEASGVT